jgi:6-pyruvoyl-tetrahydropterin synthase
MFERQAELYSDLDYQDFLIVEQALADIIATYDHVGLFETSENLSVTLTAKTIVETAAEQLVGMWDNNERNEDAAEDVEALLATLKNFWTIVEGVESPINETLEEGFMKRAKNMYSKGRRGYSKTKNGYHKAKNSRAGRSAKRLAKGAKRLSKSKAGGLLKRGVASLVGF